MKTWIDVKLLLSWLLSDFSQENLHHVVPVVSGFCSASGPLAVLPNRLPAMAPSIPVAAVSCSSTLTRITAPWSNSLVQIVANMRDAIGKVQLPARMAIPKKVRNAVSGDRVCGRVFLS